MKQKERTPWRLGVAIFGAVVVVQTLAGATLASAQATRTWVSGVGDDANPCSRTAPCKTFAGAISKTASGGEINAIDPGGFGAVTITKSITIAGNGNSTSILASGINGITVNGANIVVKVKSIAINGAGVTPGVNGIRFLQGKSLVVDDVDIFGFSGAGIQGSLGTSGNLTVRNSRLDYNGTGISLTTTSGLLRSEIVDTSMDNGTTGLYSAANSRVAVRNCTASNYASFGIRAANSGLALDTCTVQNNGTGISSETGAVTRVRGATVIDNATGLSSGAGAQLLSGGGNTVEGNGTNGAFTGTYTPK